MDFTVNNVFTCTMAYHLLTEDCLGPRSEDLLFFACPETVMDAWNRWQGWVFASGASWKQKRGPGHLTLSQSAFKKAKNKTYFLSSRSNSDTLLWALCHSIVFTINGDDENENCLIFCKAQPNRAKQRKLTSKQFLYLRGASVATEWKSTCRTVRHWKPSLHVSLKVSHCCSAMPWRYFHLWTTAAQWHNLDKNSFHSVWNLACQEHKKKCFRSTEQECRQQTQQRRRWLGLWLHSALC